MCQGEDGDTPLRDRMEGLFGRDLYGEALELDLSLPYRTFVEWDDSAFWKRSKLFKSLGEDSHDPRFMEQLDALHNAENLLIPHRYAVVRLPDR